MSNIPDEVRDAILQLVVADEEAEITDLMQEDLDNIRTWLDSLPVMPEPDWNELNAQAMNLQARIEHFPHAFAEDERGHALFKRADRTDDASNQPLRR